MALLTDSLLIDLCVVLFSLLILLYYYLTKTYNYWKDRGVPYVKPHFLFGSIKDTVFGRRNLTEIHHEIYKELEGERFGGYFILTSPNIVIRDPDLIERVMVKDFAHFQDRGFGVVDIKKEPLSANLSNLEGHQWRTMRHKMTPTFTTGKLKGMFEQICNCGEELLKELKKYSESGEPVEAKTVLTSFTTDVIATCAFGLQFKHGSEEWVQFRNMTDKIFSPSKLQLIKMFMAMCSKKLAKLLGIRSFSKDANEYFVNITKATVEFRKKNNISRNDFLQLLMTLKEQEKCEKVDPINHELNEEDAYLIQTDYKPTHNTDEIEFTDEIIAAQSFVFLTAGSESTSSTLAFTLYSITTNLPIQKKIQDEIDEVLAKHGHWNYQTVKEMTYLDQVIQESLRIHPFATVLGRICTIPYKIPESDVILEKGQNLTIPVHGIHMDSRYYPDPETFDPERFKGNNHRSSWKYMPFGDGPRMCIAMRFAVLEMKICLARILSQYNVSLSDKTLQPLKLEPSSFIPRPLGGLWFTFQQRHL